MNDIVKNTAPSVLICGCGGTGINIVDMISRISKDKESIIKRFDTSTANIKSDVNVHVLASGSGSGKVRTTHVDAIRSSISANIEEYIPEIPDVAIIVTSLGGGSGNILTTFLVKELHNRGCQPVLFLVSDPSSEVDNKNINYAIQSLSQLADSENIYLPVSVYDNSESSRSNVDKQVLTDISVLLYLLTVDTLEVDKSDRLNWLNASRTVNAECGLKLLSVYSDTTDKQNVENKTGIFDPSFKDTTFYDSVLSLGFVNSNNEVLLLDQVGIHSRFKKEGVNISDKFQGCLVGCITSNLDKIHKLIKDVNKNINMYAAKNKESKPKIVISNDDPNVIF